MKIRFSEGLWNYISPHQKDLFVTGNYLLQAFSNPNNEISDFSFLVFPFAKAYEGFLKQLFLDAGYMSEEEYESDYMRLGKLLSPNNQQDDSVYNIIKHRINNDLAKNVWYVWKRGRNEVFHYFPHNYKKIDQEEALSIIDDIVNCIEVSFKKIFDECEECKSRKYHISSVGPQGFEP